MIFKWWYHLATNPTKAELALEPAIAALGKRYRAQHLFLGLKYIADFVLLDEKVIIEVDGASHETPEQRYKDARNTLALRRLGWRTVRCRNEDAIGHPHLTMAALLENLNHLPPLEALEAALGALPPPEPKTRKPKRDTGPASAPALPGSKERTARRKPGLAE